MAGLLTKGLISQKTTQELTSYLEDILDSKIFSIWTSDASTILLNWIERVLQDGNVLCANSITRILIHYVANLDACEISTIIPIYLNLNKLIHLSVQWDEYDSLINIAFWENVNELHMKLFGLYPSFLKEHLVSIGSVLLKSCLDENISLFLRQMKLRELNFCLENSSNELRNILRTANPNCVMSLLNILDEIGDYDFQTSLIEAVFRFTSSSERSSYVSEWFPRLNYLVQHLFVRIKDFDPDCRKFLNAFNSELGSRRKVFTYPAIKAQIGNFVLKKPNIPTYEHLWVDFNVGNKTITLVFDRSDNHQGPSTERFWETVSIYSHEVETVHLRKLSTGHSLLLTISRDPSDLFPSPPSQDECNLLTNEFHIYFGTVIHNFESLCFSFYNEKLKVLNDVPENSLVQAPVSCHKESISTCFINNPRKCNAEIDDIHGPSITSETLSTIGARRDVSGKHVNSQSTPSELIPAYPTEACSMTKTFDIQSSNSTKKTSSSINVTPKIHSHVSKQKGEATESIITTEKRDRSLKVNEEFLTPHKRFLPNQNFSSSSTTSLYPSPSRGSTSSNIPVPESKLKKILNYKKTPKKNKIKKVKESTTFSNTVANDNFSPVKIYSTNEVQDVDISNDGDDFISVAIVDENISMEIKANKNSSEVSLMSLSSDEDIIPSSLLKGSKSNEEIGYKSLTDASLIKQNISKILEKSIALKRSNTYETISKGRKKVSPITDEGKEMHCFEDNNKIIDNLETKKLKDNFDSDDIIPSSLVPEEQNASLILFKKKICKYSKNEGIETVKPVFDAQSSNEIDDLKNVTDNIDDLKNVTDNIDDSTLGKCKVDEGNTTEGKETFVNLDSATSVNDSNESLLIFKNLNDISITEELVNDSVVCLGPAVYTNNENAMNQSQYGFLKVESESENILVKQSNDNKCHDRNLLSDDNEDGVILNPEGQDLEITNQLYTEANNSQECQQIIGLSKSFVNNECINIPIEVTDVIEKILSQVKECENSLNITEPCLHKLEEMNEEVTSSVIEKGNINRLDNAKEVMSQKTDIRNDFKIPNMNLVQNERTDTISNIDQAYLVAFGPKIIVKHNDNSNAESEIIKDKNTNDDNSFQKSISKLCYSKDEANSSYDIETIKNLYNENYDNVPHSTPNKLNSLNDNDIIVIDDSNNTFPSNAESVSIKKSPSKTVALTLKLLSDIPLKYPYLKTPQRSEKIHSDSAESVSGSKKKKPKRKGLPDHYGVNLSSRKALKSKELTNSAKKRLFNAENSILDSTPPEKEIIEIDKLHPFSSEKYDSNKDESASQLKIVTNEKPLNDFQIFRSKQNEKFINSKQNEKVIKKSGAIFKDKQKKNSQKTIQQTKSHSIFSDFDLSDSSSSEKWLHKKTVNKSTVKTYPGKYRKRIYQEESSDSDEYFADRKKKRKNRIPVRPYVNNSTSETEDSRLFKSPKCRNFDKNLPERRIITRSMTYNQNDTKNILPSRRKERSQNSEKLPSTKRKFSSLVKTLGHFSSSPEVMRDTSLSQAASSFDEVSQISDFKLINSKRSKRRKSALGNVDKPASRNACEAVTVETNRSGVRKVNLAPVALEYSSDARFILPPNPPNTPVTVIETTPYSDSGPPLQASSENSLVFSLRTNNFEPRSTSSPRFSYIGEKNDSFASSLENSQQQDKSLLFNHGIDTKLNFEPNEKVSEEKSGEYNICKGDIMIPTRPNSDYSSSEEIDSIHKEFPKECEIGKIKSSKNKKAVLYVRKKDGDFTEIKDKTGECLSPLDKTEECLSPLIPQSLKNLSSPSQRSEINSLPQSLCPNPIKIQSLKSSDEKCKLVESKDLVKSRRNETSAQANSTDVNMMPFMVSMTPPSSLNTDFLKTPSKIVPKSLFVFEHSNAEPRKMIKSETTVDSSQPRRINEHEVQKSKNSDDENSDYVSMPSSTLRLLMDEVRSVKESFIQESHRCSVMLDVFKSILNSKKSSRTGK